MLGKIARQGVSGIRKNNSIAKIPISLRLFDVLDYTDGTRENHSSVTPTSKGDLKSGTRICMEPKTVPAVG